MPRFVAIILIALVVFLTLAVAAFISNGSNVIGASLVTPTPPVAQFFQEWVPGTHAAPGIGHPIPYGGNGWSPTGGAQP